MAIPNKQIGWTEKANMLYEVSKALDKLIHVAAYKNTKLIINIINSITGEFDLTYEDATSSLVIMYGGVGGGSVLENLNELDVILGGSGNFTTNLSALNNIDLLSGGTGTHTSEYRAWVSLGAHVNPPVPSDAITFEGETDLLTFEGETEIITFEI
jgi:hypothetical protein